MIYNTNTFCDGCDKNCEYGYFINDADGAIYPVLNYRVVTDYWVSRSERTFIKPGTVKTVQQALDIAHDVAGRCNHNVCNQRVKQK